MRIIAVPPRLRWAVSALFLCIPLGAFEVIRATRAPWWSLPYREIAIWCTVIALMCIPMASWFMAGRRWGLYVYYAFSATWVVMSAWIALRKSYPALGFFTLFLLWYLAMIGIWIRRELARSYYDPRLQWYQGLPKPIPGLSCEIKSPHATDSVMSLAVSRMDEEGAFVFSDAPEMRKGIPLQDFERPPIELTFGFRDQRISCQGALMVALDDQRGAGVQFTRLSPDNAKRLGDFVEMLRGAGYVS